MLLAFSLILVLFPHSTMYQQEKANAQSQAFEWLSSRYYFIPVEDREYYQTSWGISDNQINPVAIWDRFIDQSK